MVRHDEHALPVRAAPGVERGAWRWLVIGQAWMFAAFTGMSLLVIAALSALHGGAGHGPVALLATACAGALLVLASWQGLLWMLKRLEHEEPRGPGSGVLASGRGKQGRRASAAPRRMAALTPAW